MMGVTRSVRAWAQSGGCDPGPGACRRGRRDRCAGAEPLTPPMAERQVAVKQGSVDPMQNKPGCRHVQRKGVDGAESPKRHTASAALRAVWEPCKGPWTRPVGRREWPDPHRSIRHRTQPCTTGKSETALLENARSHDVALTTGARACCGLILHRVYSNSAKGAWKMRGVAAIAVLGDRASRQSRNPQTRRAAR